MQKYVILSFVIIRVVAQIIRCINNQNRDYETSICY